MSPLRVPLPEIPAKEKELREALAKIEERNLIVDGDGVIVAVRSDNPYLPYPVTDSANSLPQKEKEIKELRLALANLMDAIGNTWVLAQDCPPKVYKALLEARRVFHSGNTI